MKVIFRVGLALLTQQQETLLKGFQAQNEAAGVALRQARGAARERERLLGEENRRLAGEIGALLAEGTRGKTLVREKRIGSPAGGERKPCEGRADTPRDKSGNPEEKSGNSASEERKPL